LNGSNSLHDLVVADYRRKTPGSRALFERASDLLPGGASGNLRFFPPYPLYTASGDGCRAIDVDGASYIDCFSCNGPLLLGHRHPAVMGAIAELDAVGSLVVNPEVMVRCAEKLRELIPCAERVRFLNSGTEAVMTAVRYARAYTGKSRVIKFHGCYHGQQDPFLLGFAPGEEIFGTGVPRSAGQSLLSLPCNDVASFQQALDAHDDVAAVLIDPAMHAGGLWGADRGFLEALRSLTRERGIVLIFDEVITGFRMGLGGAQAYHGVIPDLATFAKALSAGEKLAAVVGSERVMRVTDPLAADEGPRVFQSGTGNDGTFALAAALGALGEYERLAAKGEYKALFDRVKRLETSIRSAFEKHGIGLHTNRLCSMMQMFITDLEPSFERYLALDNEILDLFYLALINEGVILTLPTSNHIYFSFTHDEAAMSEIAAGVVTVLDKYPFAEAVRAQQRGSAS